jgi:hypothetical protein
MLVPVVFCAFATTAAMLCPDTSLSNLVDVYSYPRLI